MFTTQPNRFQRGQALPVGIALLMFGVLITLVLYSSGQLVTEKSRIANTADAAVYSGMVWQARALNFKSYTNRAMVANQVSIAQFVSMASWTQYGKQTAENLNNTIGLIPIIRPYTQAVESAMTAIDQVVDGISKIAIPVISVVTQVLSYAQQGVYYSTFAVTPALVREVVKANDKDYDVDSKYAIAGLGQNAINWNSFIKRYDDEEGLGRKADIITDSRDAFTRDRGWKVGRFNLGLFRVEIRKEGTTNLVQKDGQWMWKGKDTQSIHTWKWRCKWSGCKWRHSELPVGWGAVYASNDIECKAQKSSWRGRLISNVANNSSGGKRPSLGSSGSTGGRGSLGSDSGQYAMKTCPRWGEKNKKAEKYADDYDEGISGYRGVQAYYDLNDLSEKNQDPRMLLRIEVQAEAKSLQTASAIGIGSPQKANRETNNNGFGQGMFRAEDTLAGGSVSSISTGEIFFERPVFNAKDILRINGRKKEEYGSLWNPYWQVRLVDTPKEQRLASWMLKDASLISGASGAINGAQHYIDQQASELEALRELERYADSQIDSLDDYRAQQAGLTQQLNQAAQYRQLADEQVDRAQQTVDSVGATFHALQQQVNSLEQRRDSLQALLNQTTSSATAAQLQSQIAELDKSIEETSRSVDEAATLYSNAQQSYRQYEQELFEWTDRVQSIDQQLNSVSSNIDEAQQLETEIAGIREQRGATEQLANYDASAGSNYFDNVSNAQNIASMVGSGDLGGVADHFIEQGSQAVQDKIVEIAKEKLEEAITDAVKGVAKKYGGDTLEYAQATVEKTQEVLDQLDQNYIEPIREQIAELRDNFDSLRHDLQEELNSAIQDIEGNIDYLQGSMDAEVQRLTNSIQGEINSLKAQQLAETDPVIRQQLQEKIDQQTARFNIDVPNLRSQYEARITELQSGIDALESEFEKNVEKIEKEILAEIEALERRIDKIKNAVSV